VEQRHAVGQADGYSLVVVEHRQTVEQGIYGRSLSAVMHSACCTDRIQVATQPSILRRNLRACDASVVL